MQFLIGVYAIIGIGLFGGYSTWCEANRVVYGVLFPLHWLALVYAPKRRFQACRIFRTAFDPIGNLVGTVWKTIWSPGLWLLVFIWLWLRGDLSWLQDFFGR